MAHHVKQNCRAFAGFTLTEVLVSVGILGLVMSAFFAALGSGFGIVDTFRQDLRATQILTQKTEAIRLCTWDQLHSLPSTFPDYYYSSGATNGAVGVTYYGTISVGPATCITNTTSYYDDVNLVTIGLVWTNYLGLHPIVHNLQMTTLVSYYGLFNYLTSTNLMNP